MCWLHTYRMAEYASTADTACPANGTNRVSCRPASRWLTLPNTFNTNCRVMLLPTSVDPTAVMAL